ncbi:putative ribonuclease H-like domain-containing protein [Tanacetum coccineum]
MHISNSNYNYVLPELTNTLPVLTIYTTSTNYDNSSTSTNKCTSRTNYYTNRINTKFLTNYVPVVAGNQTNGIAGTKDNIVAGQVEKKKAPEQEYIMIPFCTTDPLISQGPKDSDDDAGKKPTEVNESGVSDNDVQVDQATRGELERLLQQEKQTEHINSTNSFNTVSPPISTAGPSFANDTLSSPVNTAGTPASTNAFEEHSFARFSPFKNAFSLPHVLNVTPTNDTRIFSNAYDDKDVEEEVDMKNVVSYYTVPDAAFTKFLKDHSKDQIEPKKPVQALKDPSWVEAMQDELLQFKLLKGYTQEEGIDYDEVFAPVARIEAIRLFLAYASFKGFVVYQMDVKSAFLYGKIEDEVYVCQPPGFEDPDFPDKVYKVEKALYGLHQAPRAWYETLSTYLLENGFHRGQIDKTLFIKRHKDDILLVQVYVDDIIFGSTKKELSTEFGQLMYDKFQMSSMGELSFFLGLQVQQKSNRIFISQDKYVVEILKKFDFVTVKTASTPMEPNKALIKDEEAEDVSSYSKDFTSLCCEEDL